MVEMDQSSSPQFLPDANMDECDSQAEQLGQGDTDMSDAGQLALQRDPRRHPSFSPVHR